MYDQRISVTVALSVYNVYPYIRQSIECILNQSFTDFELLCIDDASSDGTWPVLEEYARRDKRIRLLRQPSNQGLSVSRNLAIKEAKGKYLLMLDGDDLFAPDMLEKAVLKAEETRADMVMWDYVVFEDPAQIYKKSIIPSSLIGVDPSNKDLLLKRPAFIWVRLLNTDILRRLGIYFEPGLTKQDIPVHWKLITTLDKIALITERLSYYRIQPRSTSFRKDSSVFSLAYVMDIVKKQLVDDGIYDQYRDEFLRSRLSLLSGMYDIVLPGLKAEAMKLIEERLSDDEMDYVGNPHNNLSSRAQWFYGMISGDTWQSIKYQAYTIIRSVYRLMKKSS